VMDEGEIGRIKPSAAAPWRLHPMIVRHTGRGRRLFGQVTGGGALAR
jgi:hypothetical protein